VRLAFVAILVGHTARAGVAVQAPHDDGDRPWLVVEGGAMRGYADTTGLVPGMRLCVQWPFGATLALAVGSRHRTGYHELSSTALVGYQLAIGRGRWRGWAGLEAGIGEVIETPTDGVASYTTALVGAPVVGLAVRAGAAWSIAIEGELTTAVERNAGVTTARAVPGAWLGVAVAL